MAYKLNSQVTVYNTPEEARAAGKIDQVEKGKDGNLYATPHQGWLLKNMPWLVLGTIGAGAGLAALPAAASGAAGAGAAGTAAGATAGTGATVAATAAPSLAGTLLKYGLQYGLPVAGGLISSKVAANANTDAARLEADYNNRALDAALEEQAYQRRQGEDERAYQRRIDEYERSKGNESTGYDRSKYNEATNYSRRNYGDFVETLEPYRSAGANANQYASRLLGLPAPNDSGATYLDLARDARTPVNLPTNVNLPTGAPNVSFPSGGEGGPLPPGFVGPGGAPTSSGMPVGGQSRLVTMQAPPGPNGEPGQVKQVPFDQQAHYESLGARRVG